MACRRIAIGPVRDAIRVPQQKEGGKPTFGVRMKALEWESFQEHKDIALDYLFFGNMTDEVWRKGGGLADRSL